MNTTIRPFKDSDWPQVWQILKPVFRAGDTYAFDPGITESKAREIWVKSPAATWVAVAEGGEFLGTYYIKANQGGGGKHVCNCGYVVDSKARGQGVASLMCEHSQAEAISMDFRAMQYNFVVSTNGGAVRLWQRHGFDIVGTLTNAFRHPTKGYVDAFVMYKELGYLACGNRVACDAP